MIHCIVTDHPNKSRIGERWDVDLPSGKVFYSSKAYKGQWGVTYDDQWLHVTELALKPDNPRTFIHLNSTIELQEIQS